MQNPDKLSKKTEPEVEFETELIIDSETGEVFLNRDDEIMLELAKALSDENAEFEAFFHSKPLDIEGKSDYNSFCG